MKLTTVELSKVKSINVKSQNINSLQGINYFTSLTSLNAASNHLKELDISGLKKLTTLYLADNNLSSIDFSNNVLLKNISLNNNQLSSIDVSKLLSLAQLAVSSNQLIELDVSKNLELKQLSVNNNLLSGLDLSKNQLLTNYLSVYNNKLINLNLIENISVSKLQQNPNQIISRDGTYDLRKLSDSVIPTRISNIEGATIHGTILSGLENNIDVTYDYDCGNDQILKVVLKVKVKEQNSWLVEPSVDNWNLGNSPSTPVGKAKYGEVIFTYSNSIDNGFTTSIPAASGQWYMKAKVLETDDYTGLEKIVPFQILFDNPATGNNSMTILVCTIFIVIISTIIVFNRRKLKI